LIARAMIGALGVTLVLAVTGGYVISRRVAARLDAINRNSAAILEGDLSRRMPVTGTGDEFDELAENLNRMLDRIAALMAGMREVSDSIAHDMRSPISRLRSRIEVALMGPPDANAYREALEQTVTDSDAILAMFNSLLTIALAESGVPRERFTTVDLTRIARDTVEIYEPVAEDAAVSVVLDAKSPVTLPGDPHLLTQAIANLLDNAIKYVPRGGKVEVRVARDPSGAQLTVADDGPGIPAAFRDKALERWTRVDESRTTPGSGLGLSLVRAVARLHGGSIDLADNQPGLRVILHFPA
jgi:signal transduction histidine kinase